MFCPDYCPRPIVSFTAASTRQHTPTTRTTEISSNPNNTATPNTSNATMRAAHRLREPHANNDAVVLSGGRFMIDVGDPPTIERAAQEIEHALARREVSVVAELKPEKIRRAADEIHHHLDVDEIVCGSEAGTPFVHAQEA
jgi:hypothetical protein